MKFESVNFLSNPPRYISLVSGETAYSPKSMRSIPALQSNSMRIGFLVIAFVFRVQKLLSFLLSDVYSEIHLILRAA